MRGLLAILLLCGSGFAQTIEKRTGEIIMLTVKNADPADSFSVYRKWGTNAPVAIGAISSLPNVWTYTWSTTMPSGRPNNRDFSYWVELKKNNLVAGKSNVVPVRWKR
jgi:hypothetical protein